MDCDESKCTTHHAYYVWVPLVTMIQAAISYLPHYLWYYWEGFKMRKLLGNILEKKFYNDHKAETCRLSPSDGFQSVCSSGQYYRKFEVKLWVKPNLGLSC